MEMRRWRLGRLFLWTSVHVITSHAYSWSQAAVCSCSGLCGCRLQDYPSLFIQTASCRDALAAHHPPQESSPASRFRDTSETRGARTHKHCDRPSGKGRPGLEGSCTKSLTDTCPACIFQPGRLSSLNTSLVEKEAGLGLSHQVETS